MSKPRKWDEYELEVKIDEGTKWLYETILEYGQIIYMLADELGYKIIDTRLQGQPFKIEKKK